MEKFTVTYSARQFKKLLELRGEDTEKLKKYGYYHYNLVNNTYYWNTTK